MAVPVAAVAVLAVVCAVDAVGIGVIDDGSRSEIVYVTATDCARGGERCRLVFTHSG